MRLIYWCVTICLLLQLSEINDKMSEIPPTSDSYMIHTLQRHREILNVNIVFFLFNLNANILTCKNK